jgi:tetratricopeptide (TPR) repeat protein
MAARVQQVNGQSSSLQQSSGVDRKTIRSLHLLQQEIDGTDEPATKAGCYLLQGLLYAKYGLHVEAIHAYKEALVFSPDNPMVCAKLADSLRQTGLSF